jgi:hypothetical protein
MITKRLLLKSILLRSMLGLVVASAVRAQSTPEMREVLDRLQKLEKSNGELMGEIQLLRNELAAARLAANPSRVTEGPVRARDLPLIQLVDPKAVEEAAASDHDQIAVDKARIEELAQTKVESSQKLPVRVTGMALFNAYGNSRYNGGNENTAVASLLPGDATQGGTLRQTVLGIQYESPKSVFGARVTGNLFADFFGGSGDSLNHLVRLRTATITLDWGSTAVTVGQDKPLISPRDPNSYAQVGVSPLTGAGNLWLWQPQANIEQRFRFGASAGLRAQLGVFQTRELGDEGNGYNDYVPPPTGNFTIPAERPDPGVESRLEFWRRWGENTRIEIAPGYHYSSSHAGSSNIPTQIYTVDWLIKPFEHFEFSGFYYTGQNVASLGALPQGFVFGTSGRAHVVHSTGGWAQVRIPVTQRLAFDFYGGTQDDRNRDLYNGYIGSNRGYFTNAQYRIAPNVILSLEGGQIRTQYLGTWTRLNNHYDLAVAYLF